MRKLHYFYFILKSTSTAHKIQTARADGNMLSPSLIFQHILYGFRSILKSVQGFDPFICFSCVCLLFFILIDQCCQLIFNFSSRSITYESFTTLDIVISPICIFFRKNYNTALFLCPYDPGSWLENALRDL